MNRPGAPSRRDVLSMASAGAVASVAGCLGGSGSTKETVESLPTPVQGDPDAAVTVAVFEDFACPHCRAYAVDVHPRVVTDYVDPGTIRYEHHDFPIPVHDRWSWEAPGAARAIQDTVGDEAFFSFTKRLFEDGWGSDGMAYSESLLREAADAVGGDPDTVVSAANQDRYRPVLEADREAGTDRGVRGTPAVFVNGEQLEAPDYQTIASAIESAR